jgi:hypothetical protein
MLRRLVPTTEENPRYQCGHVTKGTRHGTDKTPAMKIMNGDKITSSADDVTGLEVRASVGAGGMVEMYSDGVGSNVEGPRVRLNSEGLKLGPDDGKNKFGVGAKEGRGVGMAVIDKGLVGVVDTAGAALEGTIVVVSGERGSQQGPDIWRFQAIQSLAFVR